MTLAFKPRLQYLFGLWFLSQSWFHHIIKKIITFFFVQNISPIFDYISSFWGCTFGILYFIYGLYYSGDIKKWQAVELHHRKLLKIVSVFCCIAEAIVCRMFFLLEILAFLVPSTVIYLVEASAPNASPDSSAFLSQAKSYINSARCDYLTLRHSLNESLYLVRILILSMLSLSGILLSFCLIALAFCDSPSVWVLQAPSIAVSISDALVSFFSFALLIACQSE